MSARTVTTMTSVVSGGCPQSLSPLPATDSAIVGSVGNRWDRPARACGRTRDATE